MPRQPLALTVIGGFLGAGKTTLLNHWLRSAGGRRLAVLVNDFGAINIDADLVESAAADMVALTNGCVCCQIGDDLTAALIRVLDAPTPFDAVVVEASGVSDPMRIARFGLAGSDLRLDGVIVLVDASVVGAQASDRLLADSLERQVASADLLVLNKTDIATPRQRGSARAWLDRIVPRTARIETARAEIPLPLLSGLALDALAHPGAAAEPLPSSPGQAGTDHGAHFETWSARPRHVLAAAGLRAWLRAMPDGVLRLKGFVRTDELGWSELQFAGRRGSLRRAEVEPASGAAVVAIGLRRSLPRAALDAAFAAGRAAAA